MRGRQLIYLAMLTWGMVFFAALGQAGDFVPVYHPTLVVSRASGPIETDGDLGDAGWQGAAKADNFAEHKPGDQTQPEVNTEVLITYDDDNLYVAFLCYDDPKEVRTSFCTRDNIFNDDNVFVCLDTYGESAVAYEIAANPYGIQGDLLFSPANGEDITYDLIYRAAGRITDFGWVVEMAIPFSSLRFPSCRDQAWRADFWRNRPRNTRYQYSWAAYDRDESCWPCQWGTITGVSGVKPGRGFEILPSVVAHQAGHRNKLSQFKNEKIKGNAGLGISYDLSSELTAEATINPDFSQVESDAAQIDVNTTFALFYPERRPFFQEGSDLFNTYFTAVYTRSINDPLLAGKMVLRRGSNNVALLSARDEHSVVTLPFEEKSEFVENGKSYSNILRAKKEFGSQSHLGFIATDRRFDGGGSGSLVGLDGQLRFASVNALQFEVLAAHTLEIDNPALGDTSWRHIRFDGGRHTAALDGEAFWGHAYFASLERETGDYAIGGEYREYSPTFRADNGLEPSNNSRAGTLWIVGVSRFDDSRILETIVGKAVFGRKWNFAGTAKDKWGEASLELALRKAQAAMHAEYTRDDELFRGKQFDGTWLAHNCISLQPSGAVNCSANINYGHCIARRQLVMGKEMSYGCSANLKPTDRLLASFSYSRVASDDLDTGERLFSQSVFRSKLSLQMLRELSARIVFQYNDRSNTWEVDPLLTYQLNPFSIFYVGSTYDYQDSDPAEGGRDAWTMTGRQYFLKLQYLFRT